MTVWSTGMGCDSKKGWLQFWRSSSASPLKALHWKERKLHCYTIECYQGTRNLMISKMNLLFPCADCRFCLQTCLLFSLSKAIPFLGRFFSWQDIPSTLKLPKCHIDESFRPNVLTCTESLQKMVQKIGYILVTYPKYSIFCESYNPSLSTPKY